ncbi:MAG: crotonase/enoyl-CoA hydratase family protein [Bacteroidota bacterium]
MNYKTFLVDIADKVAHVRLNRPDKANALNHDAWAELKLIFETLDNEPSVRVIILSGEGKHFCAGIDLAYLMEQNQANQHPDEGRKRENFRRHVLWLQSTVTAIENCRKPVLAAIDNGCIGAGVDIVSACDMRYITEKGYFSVREIDMAIVADLGTLQRLPKIISEGMAREMAFSGRKVGAEEALRIGLVNRVYVDREEMLTQVMALAKSMAQKSPLTMRGTKEVMNYSRDHGVEEGLKYTATWNSGMLFSEDLVKAVQAAMMKQEAEYRD